MSEDNHNNNNSNSNSNPQAGANRPLPKKEADLFRAVVRHYESKQYKKAIKTADTILKKYPTHGETLAMKGLTLNAINYHGKRDEAHELVKRALTYDMRSHVCWHVYGLLHRSDRNYNEAIKAYKQALKLDPQNLQILRDLSNLQIQLRDVDGFVATRNALLTLKPNAKANWMAFALAKHLAGEHRDAANIIDVYLGTLTDQSDEWGRCFESSELALYKNQILAEIPNNFREALEHLGACEKVVVDRTAWLAAKAEYQLALRDYEGAKTTVREAFDRGQTEDFRVHTLYQSCVLEWDDRDVLREALRLKGTQTLATRVPLSHEQRDRIREAYANDLLPSYPTSYAVQTIPISLLSLSAASNGSSSQSSSSSSSATETIPGPAATGLLREALEERCRRGLSKGVPSLCSELASFVWVERNGRCARPDDPVDYASHPVFQIIAAMADSFVSCLETESKFAASDPDVQPPATLLWARFLRAGLCELSGEYGRGLELVDQCLQSDPTEVDVYELKTRLLERSGAPDQASACIDQARELDPQDRYMNNLTTRYLLRAGRDDQALRTISLFAKHEGNPEQNLFDMQCSWYELEVAEHFARKQEWGRSLKKYAAVVKHFDDINEDQFDFHGYCLRKVTLRAYVDVLRFEDEAYGQEYYSRAAAGIVRVYLHLMDHPPTDDSAEPDYSSMTAAERKKAKAIARKKKKAAEKKEEEQAAAAVAAGSQSGSSGSEGGHANATSNGTTNHNSSKPKGGGGAPATAGTGKPSFVEEDPRGKELVSKDPAEEARKYVSVLVQYAPKSVDSWLLCYDVAVRRKKGLLALRALRIAQSLGDDDDDSVSGHVLWRIVDLATQSDSLLGHLSAPAQVVFFEQLSLLLGGSSLSSFVKGAVASLLANPRASSLPYRTALAKAAMQAGTHAREEAAQWIVAGGWSPDPRGVTVESCRDALSVLRSLFGDGDTDSASAVVQEWKEQVQKRYPLVKDWS